MEVENSRDESSLGDYIMDSPECEIKGLGSAHTGSLMLSVFWS
jgi:hypothetical protein